jgi:hypothetical protein
MNVRFINNLLLLNFDKTHYLQFTTKNNPVIYINIGYNKHNVNTTSTQFLATIIDTVLSFKSHIHKFMGKLSKACYAVRLVKGFIRQESLKMVYSSYFHTIMS